MEKYYIKILTAVDVTDEVIHQWKLLWERAENANIFNSYEWFLTCQKTEENKNYEIIMCYQEEKLVALLPLQIYRQFGIKVYGSIGNSQLVDTPFLIEKYEKGLMKYFFTFIYSKKNIYLQKIDSKAVSLIHTLFPSSFFTLMSVNPIISMTDDPLNTISQSTVKQIKKIIRKNDNQLRFIMFEDNLQKHLQTMFSLSEKSSKNIRSMDIFSHKETRNLYQEIVKNCSKLVRICFLYLNDLPIAYQYGYMEKDTFICDQIAYRNEYSKLRPGKTILYFLIEYLKKSEIKSMDLGGGISSYKMEFTQEYRLLYNMYYSPNIFIMLWWKAINSVRRMKQIILPLKHTRDHEFLFKEFSKI